MPACRRNRLRGQTQQCVQGRVGAAPALGAQRGALRGGLTWAKATAAGASPSLSDSSSLLFSESCSRFQAWAGVAAGPAFPGGAGAAPFPGGPVAEVTLPCAFFPKRFAWE